MRSPFPRTHGPRNKLRARLALAGLAAVIVGLVLFSFQHRIDRVDPGSRPVAREGQSTYRNRALTQRPAAAAKADPARKPAISGFVYDLQGAPIEGASLIAATFEIAGNIPSTAGAVKSDDKGYFSLVVPEGTYQVNATKEGYGPTAVTAHTGDTASLVLPRSGLVLGHVRDEKGAPVKRFAIDVVSAVPIDMPAPPPLLSRQIESADGSFRVDQIPAWDVVIRATAEGFAPAYSPQLTVRPGETSELELVVMKGCALVGRVENKAGAPVENVLVDAEARFYTGSASELSIQTADQARTGADGAFRLENISKGAVVVRGYDGSSAVATTEVNITECDKLSPVKLVLSSGGGVSGVARLGDGTPLAGARLTLMHRSIGFVNVTSGESGVFRFEQIPAGPVRLELHHEGELALQFLDVTDGKDTLADMTLPTRGTGGLRGRITAGGRPLSGARLLVAANRGRELGVGIYHPVTAADGTYELSAMEKGAYLVSVMSTTAAAGVQIKPDQTSTVNLDVTPKAQRRDPEEIAPKRR